MQRDGPRSLGPGARVDHGRRFGGARLAEADGRGDDAVVDHGQVLAEAGIEAVLARLDDDLVALDAVKRRVREIAALLVVDRLRRSVGLATEPPTLHMCFTGNPGTGKTTVARRMGELLHGLGYTRRPQVVSVSRDDLVGQYVGHTAPKTRQVLERAMGGVLFIDEAYHIYRVDNERDYGQETVEILLEVMEDQRQDLVVIMAGYKRELDRFFADVPGLASRIAHHIDFPDYAGAELAEIGRRMLAEQGYRFTPEAEAAFAEYLARRRAQPRFANGRTVRNALDRLRLRQAVRLYEAAAAGRALTRGDLARIEAADVRASRVFQSGSWAGS